MRTFVALSVPGFCRETIAAFAGQCSLQRTHGIKFVEKTNYHITLQFIGHTDPAQIQPVIDALSSIRFSPFTVILRGAGFFPENTGKPHVLWVGIEKTEPLTMLYKNIGESLHLSGFSRDSMPFTPHLTIARMKPAEDALFTSFIAGHAEKEFGSFTASSFSLYRSDASMQGPIYTPIRIFTQEQ